MQKAFISKNNLNYNLIYEYIQYGLLEHNRSTFFKNIMKVAPGNYIEIDNYVTILLLRVSLAKSF